MFIIYNLIKPDFLQKEVYENYYHKTLERSVLEELNVLGVESRFDSKELAIEEIKENTDELKDLQLTILEVFSIQYNGEIK